MMSKFTEMKIVFLAVDDGSGNIASIHTTTANEIKETIKPSSIVPRLVPDLSGSISSQAWKTEEGNSYTVAPNSSDALDTCYRDYQVSEHNRVLVHDTVASSIDGCVDGVYLGVTLPTSQYYTGDDANPINTSRIEEKRNNLMKKTSNFTGAFNDVNVLGALVYPEAIPAYVYCVQSASNANEYPDNHSTLVVDLGRYTADIALISTDYQVVNFSTTENGVYKLTGKLKQLLTRNAGDLGLNDVSTFSDHYIDQIINLGFIGSTLETDSAIAARKDVSHLVHEAKQFLSDLILSDMKAIVRDFSSLTRIVFVGGGANWLNEISQTWYHTVTIPEKPEMAVVRGTHLLLEARKESILAELNNTVKSEEKETQQNVEVSE